MTKQTTEKALIPYVPFPAWDAFVKGRVSKTEFSLVDAVETLTLKFIKEEVEDFVSCLRAFSAKGIDGGAPCHGSVVVDRFVASQYIVNYAKKNMLDLRGANINDVRKALRRVLTRYGQNDEQRAKLALEKAH
jgi:hypothetical protein